MPVGGTTTPGGEPRPGRMPSRPSSPGGTRSTSTPFERFLARARQRRPGAPRFGSAWASPTCAPAASRAPAAAGRRRGLRPRTQDDAARGRWRTAPWVSSPTCACSSRRSPRRRGCSTRPKGRRMSGSAVEKLNAARVAARGANRAPAAHPPDGRHRARAHPRQPLPGRAQAGSEARVLPGAAVRLDADADRGPGEGRGPRPPDGLPRRQERPDRGAERRSPEHGPLRGGRRPQRSRHALPARRPRLRSDLDDARGAARGGVGLLPDRGKEPDRLARRREGRRRQDPRPLPRPGHTENDTTRTTTARAELLLAVPGPRHGHLQLPRADRQPAASPTHLSATRRPAARRSTSR